MALSPDRKIEIAWEFLRRNPAYRMLWDQFSKEQSKLLRSMPRPFVRSRLRGRIGVIERLKIKYRRQFQAQFGIADFFEPTSAQPLPALKKMFRSVKPVGEFAPCELFC